MRVMSFPRLLLSLLAVLLPNASLSQDRILMTNMPNSLNSTVSVNPGSSVAYGFLMGANDFDMHSVDWHINTPLRLNVVVELFDNAPGNVPGNPILQLVGPRTISGVSRRTSFTVPANPFPFYRLESGKVYWVVITGYEAGISLAGEIGVPPAGAGITLLGKLAGPRPPKIPSSFNVSFEISGQAIPTHGMAFVNHATGRVAFASMMDGVFTRWHEFPQIVGSQWEVLGFGQFIGSAPMDAFIRNKVTGAVAVWQTNGENFTNFHQFPQAPNSAWQFKGIADFNNDGIADLLYQNPQSGTVVVGITVGNRVTQWRSFPKKPNPLWQIIGCADENNDGFADVYFRNSSTGQIAYWRTDGFDFTTWQVLTPTPGGNWQLPGVWRMNFGQPTWRPAVWFFNPQQRSVANWRHDMAGVFQAWNPVQELIPAGFTPVGYGPVR